MALQRTTRSKIIRPENQSNKPPRHPRCRSTIVAVRKGDRIADYQTDTADNFLFRNEQIAVDLLGEERYKLWIESATS
ncbi:MAG: hypothetical protein H0A75_00225 [Candidatus Methanofishera endochildressiae]|uniref:Uncharacterized protein n=1 Tax=Candidatus Methanofishera endochildressiae TaxID=2738884 RepID=A0A7Z0MMN5_9GAMM|nr:hypothetical protein [Candidatus Methanofishera endochildressiae]